MSEPNVMTFTRVCGCSGEAGFSCPHYGPHEPADPTAIREEDLEFHMWPPVPRGGQHVGAIGRGVLLIHKPTGYAVTCESERSQHGNRQGALSKLADLLNVDIVDRVERDAADAIATWLDRGCPGMTSSESVNEAIRARRWKTP